MQGLVANLSSGLNVADGVGQAANGLKAQDTAADGRSNGTSVTSQAFSPLFANLLSSATNSEQVSFQSQLNTAFAGQELPLTGQILPPDDGSHLTAQAANGLSGVNALQQPQLSTLAERELLHETNMQPVVSPLMTSDNVMRGTHLPEQLANAGTVASQLPGQGQHRLQQELLMKQLALAPVAEGEEGLSSLRGVTQLETMPVIGSGTSSANLLRDAILLKQSLTVVNGNESKAGDSFSNTLSSLVSLATDTKSGSETKSLMQASINTPFSQQASWGEEVGSRVKWMVNSQVQSAELKMNPAHLGPVEVKISVQNDQTTIHFTAQNSAVREALDSAMPRLREMLGDNGVNLADVDVSDQSFAQQQQASQQEQEALNEHPGATGGQEGDVDGHDASDAEEGEMRLSARMVDYYA